MKKIAFVVQRYGMEVNGGSELYCRQVAQKLSDMYDIEILTTCAIDYVTWANYYEEDLQEVNGLKVRRFKVKTERNNQKFNATTGKLLGDNKHSKKDEIQWMKEQGPESVELLDYIKGHKDDYDVFIFMTYLYFTTYFGLQLVADKSILIPTAHDEPYIYLSIFKSFFNLPKAILYLTEEERTFVQKNFGNQHIASDIIGIGIDRENDVDEQRFRTKFNITDDYMIYVGRIEESKGCKELFDYFIKYKKETNATIKLVLIGKSIMTIPKHKDILSLGFVSDEEKFDGIIGAEFLVLPSKYESLSMSVLESLMLETPILVNAQCEVLKSHCLRSNAGLYYMDFEEFKGCVDYLTSKPANLQLMGKNGLKYIEENYVWDVLKEKIGKMVCRVCNK